MFILLKKVIVIKILFIELLNIFVDNQHKRGWETLAKSTFLQNFRTIDHFFVSDDDLLFFSLLKANECVVENK